MGIKQFPETELGPPHVEAVTFFSVRFSYNIPKIIIIIDKIHVYRKLQTCFPFRSLKLNIRKGIVFCPNSN